MYIVDYNHKLAIYSEIQQVTWLTVKHRAQLVQAVEPYPLDLPIHNLPKILLTYSCRLREFLLMPELSFSHHQVNFELNHPSSHVSV